jgi:hypothetical protein
MLEHTDMRLRKTHALTAIMSQGKLKALQDQLGHLDRLNTLLALHLDRQFCLHVKITSYKEGVLTLGTDNSSLASQLRYLSRIYLPQLKQHDEFCDLTRIHVSITPTNGQLTAPRQRKKAPRNQLSPQAAAHLTMLADALGGGEVSEALYRLASRAK